MKTATHAFAPYFDEENQTIFSEIIHLFQICGGPENGVDVPTDDVFEDRPLVLSNSTYYKELANQVRTIYPSTTFHHLYRGSRSYRLLIIWNEF